MPLVETIRSWASGGSKSRRRNLDEIAEAQRRYEIFQGKKPDRFTTLDEPGKVRDDLAALGWLIELVFYPRGRNTRAFEIEDLAKLRRPKDDQTRDWKDVARELGICLVVLNFEHDKVAVAANGAGSQLYLVGGNQDISGQLSEFEADTTKDFIELGEAVSLTYLADKAQSNFEPMEWEHILGEESGVVPFGYWNKLQHRIYLVGGEYTVEEPGIIN